MPEPLSFWLIIAALAGLLVLVRLIAGVARWLIIRWSAPLARATTRWLRRVYGVERLMELARLRAPGPTRWVEGRFATDRFAGLPLTLVVLLAGYLVVLASHLAADVIEQEDVVHFDHTVNRMLALVRNRDVLDIFAHVTHLADPATLVAMTAVASAFLWADRRAHFLPGLWLSVVGSETITYIGKYAIDRARPHFLTFASAQTPSFPSGHATGAMAVYGFIAYAVLREVHARHLRFELAFWVGVLIALIAASRLILSVHYASDVAAGLLVGAFWLLAGFALTEYLGERTAPTVAARRP